MADLPNSKFAKIKSWFARNPKQGSFSFAALRAQSKPAIDAFMKRKAEIEKI